MKKWLVAVIGIVALLVGMTGGYLLSPDVNVWMAEMEIGQALLDRQAEAAKSIEAILSDTEIAVAMATDPRYAILAVEKEHPYFRIASVVVRNEGRSVEIWAVPDIKMIQGMFENRDEMMGALLEATGMTVKIAHEQFPGAEYIGVVWGTAYKAAVYEGDGVIVQSDISIVGSEAFVAWADNPTEDALNELAKSGDIQAIAYGWFVAPLYCTDPLPRLSSDPHPWDD